MSIESTEPVAPKKRRGTSIPLLVGFVVLGGLGYFFGEKIMTYAFYLQEMMIAASGAKGTDLPAFSLMQMEIQSPGLGLVWVALVQPPLVQLVLTLAALILVQEVPALKVLKGSGSDAPAAGAPAVGGPAAGGPAGAGGAPDPEAMFAQRDKDSNGKLEGDEIGERMQSRLSEVDTDQDKAISKDEFLTAWRNRQSAGSSASGGAGAGASRPPSDNEPK